MWCDLFDLIWFDLTQPHVIVLLMMIQYKGLGLWQWFWSFITFIQYYCIVWYSMCCGYITSLRVLHVEFITLYFNILYFIPFRFISHWFLFLFFFFHCFLSYPKPIINIRDLMIWCFSIFCSYSIDSFITSNWI